jgi:hypothetical protein
LLPFFAKNKENRLGKFKDSKNQENPGDVVSCDHVIGKIFIEIIQTFPSVGEAKTVNMKLKN